jgi:PhoH-like ATPase
VRIESNHVDVPLPPYLDKAKADHRILCVAIGLEATLVTKDAGLRIKGSQLGVAVEDYRGDTARTRSTTPASSSSTSSRTSSTCCTATARRSSTPSPPTSRACTARAGPRAVAERLPGPAGGAVGVGLGRVIDVDDDGVATVHRVAGHRQAFGMAPATCARPSRSTCCSTPTCPACR